MDSSSYTLAALLTIIGYLLGSVPFGVVVSKAMNTPDPRTAGSRNVGFTNVLRVSGKKAGFLTLAGDMGKGWLVGWVAAATLPTEAAVLCAALAPVLGHLFSPFLGFHGGKGVATALGSILGVAPTVGLALLAIWLGTVAVWRYSSGGALAAFTSAPLVAWGFDRSPSFIGFTVLVASLIWFKHTDNVVRLWQGTERRIGSGSQGR